MVAFIIYRGGAPVYGLYRYVRPQRVWFFTVLAINRVWFLHSSLELGMFLRRSYVFIIINKAISESPSVLMIRATVPNATVINRVSNFWSGHKTGQ